MEDFHCLRSRVLMCKEEAVTFEIENNNIIIEDANPLDLHWGYIDMRGNVVSTEEYVFATDYDDFIATVSKSSLGWDWNPNYGVKSPYNRYQVDVFEQMTDESRKKIVEAIEEVEKRKRNTLWNENTNNDVDEDDIMRALQNGYGDILGY